MSRQQHKRGIGPLALYIHIPFCETKCPYCDFNTYAGIEVLIPSYLAALCREIELWGQFLGGPAVRTVFLGGGTPSYVPADGIGRVLDTVRDAFDIDSTAEITLEANPDDCTDARWRRIRLWASTASVWESRASMTDCWRCWAAVTPRPRPSTRTGWSPRQASTTSASI